MGEIGADGESTWGELVLMVSCTIFSSQNVYLVARMICMACKQFFKWIHQPVSEMDTPTCF